MRKLLKPEKILGKIIAGILTIILIFSGVLPNFSMLETTYASGTPDESSICSYIENNYKKALAGRSSFNGICGTCVYCQLNADGISANQNGHGYLWYGFYPDGTVLSSGHQAHKFAGNNCLYDIVNRYGSRVYNIVVSFSHGWGSGYDFGHVVFIKAIINNTVYFTDSYDDFGKGEGQARAVSISQFMARYNGLYGDMQGATYFSTDRQPDGCLDVAEGGNGTLRVAGWAFDLDNKTAAVQVDVYIQENGGELQKVNKDKKIYANKTRTDVETAYKNEGVGSRHGFDETLSVDVTSAHTYTVYVFALNIGSEPNNPPLSGYGKIVTITSKGKVCSTPDVTFDDVFGGKQLKITAGSKETIHYQIYKDDKLYKSSDNTTDSYSENLTTTGRYSVKAWTTRSGYQKSGEQTKITTVSAVETPTITQTVTADGVTLNMTSGTSGATIYYTTSGNTPTVKSTRFTGSVTVNSEKTVKAIAIKDGYVNSAIGTAKVSLTVPKAPTNFKFTSDSTVAVGSNVNVSWSTVTGAKSYTATLYKNNVEVSHITTSGTSATLNLSTAGTYQIKVYATNVAGNGAVSSTVLTATAKAPVTVTFTDWDGTVIKAQKVSYGGNASLPDDPERKGYTFTSWTNGDKISSVKSDLTVTANYKINTYLVRFYDATGNQVGASQKVEYGASATAPVSSLTNIPSGYVFAGWKVIDAANDSACDYTKVDSDLKLQAVYYWGDEELPLVNEITSAEWNAETGNYTVSVKLTNYPTDTTTALLRVSLYTAAGKMVKSSKTEVEVLAGGNATKDITLKYSGTATVAKVCTLGLNGDDLTGSALSKEVSKSVTCLSDTAWSEWSGWSTTPVTGSDTVQVETKTQYRYSDKSTTTSSASSMSGWTLYNTTSSWGAYGSWSSWSDVAQTADQYKQVETRTEWRYYAFVCPVCGDREELQGLSNCGRYSLVDKDGITAWFPTAYKNSNYGTFTWAGSAGKRWTTSLGDGLKWMFSAGNLNDTAVGTKDTDSDAVVIRTAYRYRTRNKNNTYYYYKWSDMSSWSDTVYTASSTRKVETRTLYRYRTAVPVYADMTGTEETGTSYSFTGTINTTADLNGKLATIMVYKGKNTDPNEDQIQYIGQTTIGTGNAYSFSVTPKSEPSEISGDYTICLGIEGSTGLVNVDLLEAPKTQYTVKYVDDDGTVISTQEVAEGAKATVPDSPSKDGYLFVGWSQGTTRVYENMTVVAEYSPIQYVVAFVDSANGTVSCDTYHYGDTIKAPANPTATGKTFKKWDGLTTGATVTGNMIINAVYDTINYTVKFLDENGTAISTQTVAYGSAATPPQALDVAGKEFLGWSTDKSWWNVTANISVKPILVYAETANAPSASVYELSHAVAVTLDSATSGASIYYTIGDDTAVKKYDGNPIVITASEMDYDEEKQDDSGVVKYDVNLKTYATASGKNISETQVINYEYDWAIPTTKTYLVTFNSNGGTALSQTNIYVASDEAIGELESPTRTGYTFLGWYTAKKGGTQITAESMITKDCTVYAHWKDNSVKEKSTIKLTVKTTTYTGKAISIGKAKVTGSTGKVTYTYYTDSKCTKKTTSANGASKKGYAPKYAGTYYVKATVAADASYAKATSKAVKLVINKAKATLKVKTTSKSYTKAVVKKAQTFSIGASVTGKGTLSYAKVSGSKALTINKKTGKITIAKKTKAGTYKIKVKISAKASKNYKAATKTVTVTVKVK